jgi:hypothetical protein
MKQEDLKLWLTGLAIFAGLMLIINLKKYF